MNKEEYLKLSAIETKHWFYRGKRAIVKFWINHLLALKVSDRLIDIGCGTGIFVEEMKGECLSYGIETSLLGLGIARDCNRKFIIAGNILTLPIKDSCIKVVTVLDVLEHIQDDRKALEELVRITETSGLIIIIVPACPFLMGDWDESLGHFRRYQITDFKRLLRGLPVVVLEKRKFNNFLFFPIMIYRLLRKKMVPKGSKRLEDMQLPDMLNDILYWLLVKPAVSKSIKLSFGLSILLVLRKI